MSVMVGELRAVLGDTNPGDTAGVSTPLTSPHTSPLQSSIFKTKFRYLFHAYSVPNPPP